MAFRDFSLRDARSRLGLTVYDGDLFLDPRPKPLPIRSEIADFVQYGSDLIEMSGTEKGKSEFVIAPILLELSRMSGRRFNLFSGVEWEFDRDRGLNGVCDFLLTWGPSQHYLTPPFAVVVEAKNRDFASGFGQCIAAMYAAVLANEQEGATFPVHGVVTYGLAWKFLRIDGTRVVIDRTQYLLSDLPELMGVLDFITRRPAALAA
jgi:hypothetical protein